MKFQSNLEMVKILQVKMNFQLHIKQLTETALEAEVESHIANDILNSNRNRRNGVNKKTIKDMWHLKIIKSL